MNSSATSPRNRRPAVAIGVAVAAAALMIAAAWFKRSAPAGSLTKEVLEGAVGLLMIVALFVPYLAVPIARAKNCARRSWPMMLVGPAGSNCSHWLCSPA